MNRFITAMVVMVSAALGALPPVGASLSMPVHGDSETSTNVAFVAVQDRMGSFGFSLSCTATASNNVQVAFGTANGEVGDFSIDDAECVVGWDCGAWFVQNRVDGTRVEMPSTTTNEQKTLVWNLSCRPPFIEHERESTPIHFDPATTNWVLYTNVNDYVPSVLRDRNIEVNQ